MACLSVSFEEIIAGAAGPVEAEAAVRWLHHRRLYERPEDLVTLDGSPADMRVNPVDVPLARQKHGGSQQEPSMPPNRARKATGGAAGHGSPFEQRQVAQRRHKPADAVADGVEPRATPVEGLPPRAPLRSHGDGGGMAARRKARLCTQDLPRGWRAYSPHASQATVAKGGGGRGRQAAAGTRAPSQRSKPQGAGQQQYVSPEGLLLPSLKRALEVAHGTPPAPDQLLRWLRAAAANPHACQPDVSTAAGQAHVLGLLRCRALRVDADRRAVVRRFADAAAG